MCGLLDDTGKHLLPLSALVPLVCFAYKLMVVIGPVLYTGSIFISSFILAAAAWD